MSTITTINDSDKISESRAVINTNFSNLNTDKIETSVLDTDGTLATNSDSKLATQKATKTYADTKIASSYLDTDGTLAANSDVKIASQKAVKTYVDNNGGGFNQGFMNNGKIAVSVASNNITVSLKTLSGTDPSSSSPVKIRIGDTVRTITSALSVTKNAGTNWFNSGSAELATKEIDYFVYLGYNATDGVVIGFSRIPSANQYSDFSATTTNEKYCAISIVTNAAAGDYYELVGRFAATLSAGAGYTWSVPTFTASNLIQRPIYETRLLTWAPTFTGFSVNPTGSYQYRISSTGMMITHPSGSGGTSNATTCAFTLPFANSGNMVSFAAINVQDAGSNQSALGHIEVLAGSPTANVYKVFYRGSWTASGSKDFFFNKIFYEI